VILYFYPKDFTSGCELQACNFRDAYPKISENNALVLGISADDQPSHAKFRESLNLPFTLLVDEEAMISKAWNCYGTKTYPDGSTFTGVQRAQFIIDEAGKIIDVQNPVKAPESRILALKALGLE
jgi:peroxiredoxin Q/BCP